MAPEQATERARKGQSRERSACEFSLSTRSTTTPVRFYERWGFEPSPTDPLNLQMLFKDIRKSLA